MKDYTKAYLEEAKWFHQKYVPSIDEYVALASTTIGLQMMTMVHSLVGMGDVITEDAFKWLFGNPHVLQSSVAFCRFLNNIAGHKFEHERGHVASSIHCIVKQYGCTEQEAEEMLRKWTLDSWKDINETCLKPLAVPMPVLVRNLNVMRSLSVIYGDGMDNYTHSTNMMKDVVTALLVNPLPL